MNGRSYEIEATFIRSNKLMPQRLLPDTPANRVYCTNRMLFHIATLRGDRYWIKEYAVPHSVLPAVEAELQKRYMSRLSHGDLIIGGVALEDFDERCIVSEYLGGYTVMAWCAKDVKIAVVERVKWWLKKTGIWDYDLSPNNVMVCGGTADGEIKMIDFAKLKLSNTKAKRSRIFRQMVTGKKSRGMTANV